MWWALLALIPLYFLYRFLQGQAAKRDALIALRQTGERRTAKVLEMSAPQVIGRTGQRLTFYAARVVLRTNAASGTEELEDTVWFPEPALHLLQAGATCEVIVGTEGLAISQIENVHRVMTPVNIASTRFPWP